MTFRSWALLVAIPVGLALTAGGQHWKKSAAFSVDHAIEIPGRILEPGRYIMTLETPEGPRQVVAIYNPDETELLAAFVAIPDYDRKGRSRGSGPPETGRRAVRQTLKGRHALD